MHGECFCMGSVVWVTTRRGPEPSGRNLKSHGECFFFPWKKGTRQMLSLESVHARAGVYSEQPMQHIFICTARFVFIRAGSGSAHVSPLPGIAIFAISRIRAPPTIRRVRHVVERGKRVYIEFDRVE